MTESKMVQGECRTGSLVTEEGRVAFAHREHRINKLVIPLLEKIEKESQKPDLLYANFQGAEPDDVREAIWRLLDMGFVQITENRMIEIKPQYSADLQKLLQAG